MKSILITGGAGFIGSHLCEEFIKQQYGVICVDNLITGKKENISHLLTNPNFQFINADVSHPSIIKKLSLPITHVLHFASPAGPNPHSPKSYLKFPIETYLVNSIGTHYLLQLAQKTKAEFLFASTSEVYGNPLEHPQKETYFGNVNPLGPRACYDESKRFGEMVTLTYGQKYQLKTKIIRIFNTYGPRMNPDDGRVIPQFIIQALYNRPITIYGKGEQTRSFCYVNDLVNGIILISQKAKPYQVYNLGNDQEINIIYLAKAVIKLTNSNSQLVFKKLPVDDPEKRKPSLEKINKELGWKPTTNLEDGLINTINWFKQNLTKLSC